MGDGFSSTIALAALRITEDAAIAAARRMGGGDERTADAAAIEAMSRGLERLPARGTVVVGEGVAGAAERLFIGEETGRGEGPRVHIAVDPLEGATTTARGGPNALSVVAIAAEGGLIRMPDVYMEKIAVGPGLPRGVVALDRAPAQNLAALAKAKGTGVSDLVVCVLDRPRHADLIAKVREAGARIALIQDGDVSGVVATAVPTSGTDVYMGIGGAPEGVLAAAALRSIGGQMQARLVLRNGEDKDKAAACGLEDVGRVFGVEDLAPGDVVFAATGVTQGMILKGVRRAGGGIFTHGVVMCSTSATVRWIETYHDDGRGPAVKGAAR